MMDWAALGAPTCINAVECGNRWQEIEEELQCIEPKIKLPTSLLILAAILKTLQQTGRKVMLNTFTSHLQTNDWRLGSS